MPTPMMCDVAPGMLDNWAGFVSMVEMKFATEELGSPACTNAPVIVAGMVVASLLLRIAV